MSGRDQTLLIVDDDQVALDAFSRMLRAVGYHVLAETDPTAGLVQVDKHSPDALLVDLHMPAFDGVEFVRRLRKSVLHGQLPVAIVTGDYFLDESVAGELDALGARIYFKPVWEDDLLQIAGDLLKPRVA
jgi:two-component system response regulator PrrA